MNNKLYLLLLIIAAISIITIKSINDQEISSIGIIVSVSLILIYAINTFRKTKDNKN